MCMFLPGDDFTFSRQISGMRVPYGTAGDCYSAVEGCAQARFSIDLAGTSFRLAGHVRWQSIGKYASVRTVTTVSIWGMGNDVNVVFFLCRRGGSMDCAGVTAGIAFPSLGLVYTWKLLSPVLQN